jgi:hypothetical protein
MPSFLAFDAAADVGMVGSNDVPMRPAVSTSIVFVFPFGSQLLSSSIGTRSGGGLGVPWWLVRPMESILLLSSWYCWVSFVMVSFWVWMVWLSSNMWSLSDAAAVARFTRASLAWSSWLAMRALVPWKPPCLLGGCLLAALELSLGGCEVSLEVCVCAVSDRFVFPFLTFFAHYAGVEDSGVYCIHDVVVGDGAAHISGEFVVGHCALNEVGEWAVGVPFGRESAFVFHDHVAIDGTFIETVLEHCADSCVLEPEMWAFNARE